MREAKEGARATGGMQSLELACVGRSGYPSRNSKQVSGRREPMEKRVEPLEIKTTTDGMIDLTLGEISKMTKQQ